MEIYAEKIGGLFPEANLKKEKYAPVIESQNDVQTGSINRRLWQFSKKVRCNDDYEG